MTGLHTNALRSSSAVAGKFMVEQTLIHRFHGMRDPAEQEDASFLLQVDGPLCSNILSESHPQAQLTGAALVDGGWQTHRRLVDLS